MAGKLVWHGESIQRQIRAEMLRRIETCCRLVLERAKKLIGVEGTGRHARAFKYRLKDGTVRKKRKGSLIYGADPSAPGDPPHKQRGRLLNSLAREVDAESLTGRVGTNLLYGLLLEIGSRLMAARPWLRVALADCRDAILKILSAPMKGP